MKIILICLAAWNVFAFLITGYDKLIAGTKIRRIRERTLLLLAACFGATGVYAAMQLFRHKTLHNKFKYGVPLLLGVNVILGYFLWRWLS